MANSIKHNHRKKMSVSKRKRKSLCRSILLLSLLLPTSGGIITGGGGSNKEKKRESVKCDDGETDCDGNVRVENLPTNGGLNRGKRDSPAAQEAKQHHQREKISSPSDPPQIQSPMYFEEGVDDRREKRRPHRHSAEENEEVDDKSISKDDVGIAKNSIKDESSTVPGEKCVESNEKKIAAPMEQQRQMEYFTKWAIKDMGIDTILSVDMFDYPNPTDDGETTIQIRGLAASRHVVPGETLISIPINSLITKQTIHTDPFFSSIISHIPDDEFSHLVLFILRNLSLGPKSDIFHYLKILLMAPSDTPLLWNFDRLNKTYPYGSGPRSAIDKLTAEVERLYVNTIPPLRLSHPETFDPPLEGKDQEWMYSLEKFKWAHATVRSRYWHLPVRDLDGDQNTPQHIGEADRQQQQHAFLAPFADMINFGPPCTRSQYNPTSHRFEILSTCEFFTGQEVTFWYTDDCADLVMANYGFTHEMIKPCPTIDDALQRLSLLESRLEDSWGEVERLREKLEDCGCVDDEVMDDNSVGKDDFTSNGGGQKLRGERARVANNLDDIGL